MRHKLPTLTVVSLSGQLTKVRVLPGYFHESCTSLCKSLEENGGSLLARTTIRFKTHVSPYPAVNDWRGNRALR